MKDYRPNDIVAYGVGALKHDTPFWCKVRSKISYSPSLALMSCDLGLRKCGKCDGCVNKIGGIGSFFTRK